MTDSPAHALLAPSSAHRWGPGGCPGSPAMEARYPEDTESQAAREGTAAHWVLEQILRGDGTNAPSPGTLAPNGHPVTLEMLEGVKALVSDISGTIAAASPGSTLRVEERVYAAETVHRENWGTPDAYLLDRPARRLHVWDFKFGHRPHDPFRHWQMVDYVACIMDSEGFTFDDILTHSYTLTIGQPRAYHPDGPVREWHAPGTEIGPLLLQLRAAAHAALEPDAPCRTGPHCRNCLAEWDCRANQLAGGAAIDLAYEQQSTGMDAAALGLEARLVSAAVERLTARQSALDERILGLIRGGESVPHWALGWTKPRTVWREGTTAEVAAMTDLMGIDIRKPEVAVVTPAQAAKLGVDQSVIDEYAVTPKGTAKLVPSDESNAARVFGQR